MPKQQDKPEGVTGSLRGWRAIYQYLGVSLSCARAWDRWHGLPVMRMPGGGVFTTKSLIDQWVLARVQARRDAMREKLEAGPGAIGQEKP